MYLRILLTNLQRATTEVIRTPAQRSLAIAVASLLLATAFRIVQIKAASGSQILPSNAGHLLIALIKAGASDTAVAAALAVLHFAFTFKARSKQQSWWAVGWGLVLLAPVIALHVVSVPFTRLYRTPLHFTQLLLVGSLSNIAESARAEVSFGYVIGAAGLVVVCLAATPWIASKVHYLIVRQSHRMHLYLGGGLLSLSLLGVWTAGYWQTTNEAQAAGSVSNPTYVFVQSWVQWLRLRFTQEQSMKNAPHFVSTRMFDKQVENEPLDSLVITENFPKRRNNVILMVVESASVNRLGLWRGDPRTTPSLNKLKPHALLFDNYYSPVPVSMKSLLSLTCSTYPHADPEADTYTNPTIDCRSLSEMFFDAGYQSALFHAGHFSYTDKHLFFAGRGYGVMRDARSLKNEKNYPINGWGIDDRAMFDEALDWLKQVDASRPFFLTLISLSPHHPYKINNLFPAPFGTSSSQAKYDNAVHLVDSQIGRVWNWLVDNNLQDDTLFVVVGDHGEAFGEHPGHYIHGSLIYEEAVRTPLMLIHPSLFKGARTSRIGNHLDLAPTILETVGIPAPKRYQGVSLLQAYKPHMVYFYANWSAHRMGLRDGRWKYIYSPAADVHELFDLIKDPAEQHNIASSYPQYTAAYKKRVTDWEAYYQELIPNYERYVLGATMCPGSIVCYLDELKPFYSYGVWRPNVSASRRRPLRIKDQFYARGIGVKPLSVLRYSIVGADFRRLKGAVGFDGFIPRTQLTAHFSVEIYVDDVLTWSSGKMSVATEAKAFDISVKGGRKLELYSYDMDGLGQQDYINWVDVRLER